MSYEMNYNVLLTDLQNYIDRDDDKLISMLPFIINNAEIRCAREVKNLFLKTVVVSNFQKGVFTYIKPDRWLEVVSINCANPTIYNITERACYVNGQATITLSAANNFAIGDIINVTGMTDADYNNSALISAVTPFTVTYAASVTTEPLTSDTTGICYVSSELENRKTLYPKSYEFCISYWPDRTQKGVPDFYSDYNYNNWFFTPTPIANLPFEAIVFQRPEPLSKTNTTNIFTEKTPDLLFYACLLELSSYLKNDSRIPVWKDYYLQSATSIKKENLERVNDASIQRQEKQ